MQYGRERKTSPEADEAEEAMLTQQIEELQTEKYDLFAVQVSPRVLDSINIMYSFRF